VTTNNTVLLPNGNPLTLPDIAFYGSSGETSTQDATTYGVQNSEPLSILAGFDNNAPDEYQITLTERTKDGGLIESDTLFANAVPEPASGFLFGTLTLGVFVLGRRRLSAPKSTL
jgi:hypothetical protein